MSDIFGDELFDSFLTKPKKKEPAAASPPQEAPKAQMTQESNKRKASPPLEAPKVTQESNKRKSDGDKSEESQPVKKKKSKKKVNNSSSDDKEEGQSFSPFSVRFRNDILYKRYGPRILRFLQQIASEPDFPITATDDDPVEMEIHGSFSFDVDPKNENEEVNPEQPVYDMHYKGVFQDGEVKEEKDDGAGARIQHKVMCFNCLGNHNLKDCKEPKNYRVISENRMEFTKNKSSTPKSLRYHVELDNSGERGAVRPGVLSDKLRDALGVASNELPMYIYKMRVLGYPPGWLEEAKSETSGLAIINNVQEDDAEPEEIKVQYDFKKIHDYPGFNVWPTEGTQDYAYNMGFPPMMPHHLKANWEKQLQGSLIKPTNRSKAPMLESSSKRTPNRDSNSNSSLPEGFATPCSSRRGPLKLPPCKSTSNQRMDTLSPSLDELEEKKRLLMEELETPTKEKEVDASPTTVNFGTPIPKKQAAEQKIPGADKFSKSITDYIPFENLPGYTGKYNQLNKLLKKVRSKVKDLQNTSD